MRVLLDTCVISEIRRPRGSSQVKEAVAGLLPDEAFLSVITIGEVANGIAGLAEGPRQQALRLWLDGLERRYSGRILPIDADTGRLWGELTGEMRRAGQALGAADGLIAATAHRHGLIVMTRNVADFAATGVRIIDPWTTA